MFTWMRKASRNDVEELRADVRRLRQEWDDWLEKADRRLARIRMRERADREAETADEATTNADPLAHLDPISRRIWQQRLAHGHVIGGVNGVLSSLPPGGIRGR